MGKHNFHRSAIVLAVCCALAAQKCFAGDVNVDGCLFRTANTYDTALSDGERSITPASSPYDSAKVDQLQLTPKEAIYTADSCKKNLEDNKEDNCCSLVESGDGDAKVTTCLPKVCADKKLDNYEACSELLQSEDSACKFGDFTANLNKGDDAVEGDGDPELTEGANGKILSVWYTYTGGFSNFVKASVPWPATKSWSVEKTTQYANQGMTAADAKKMWDVISSSNVGAYVVDFGTDSGVSKWAAGPTGVELPKGAAEAGWIPFVVVWAQMLKRAVDNSLTVPEDLSCPDLAKDETKIWMTTFANKIQGAKQFNLGDWLVLGSHDAGTVKGTISGGPSSKLAKDFGFCQNHNVLKQLNSGVRFFDIRTCKRANGNYIIHPNNVMEAIKKKHIGTGHGVKEASMFFESVDVIVNNIKGWLEKLGDAGGEGEILYLRIKPETPGSKADLQQLIVEKLKPWIFPKQPSVSSLKTVKYEDVINFVDSENAGGPAKPGPRVILLFYPGALIGSSGGKAKPVDKMGANDIWWVYKNQMAGEGNAKHSANPANVAQANAVRTFTIQKQEKTMAKMQGGPSFRFARGDESLRGSSGLVLQQ